MAEYPTEQETLAAVQQMLGADGEDAIAEPDESDVSSTLDPDDQAEAEEAFLSALFGTSEPPPAEAPIEGLPPKDKPIADYSPEETAASHELMERNWKARAERRDAEEQEARERERTEADRTDAQRHGDALRASVQPGVKAAAQAAFIRSIHGSGKE